MPHRRLPVRPDLDQLKRQAKKLLREMRRGDPAALAEFEAFHPKPPGPALARLADAQLVLARAYQAPSWPRLVDACRLVDAIWEDDRAALKALIARRPELVREPVLLRESNWGPPLSYAANLGRDAMIEMLREAGAEDLAHAFGRAVLQNRIDTARRLRRMMGDPPFPDDVLAGPAYTLRAEATAYLLEAGAKLQGEGGRRLAPVGIVLGSDSRNPPAKHAILDLYATHGFALPDTPTMALHRGRIDLLETHLAVDPGLLGRRFGYAEIYPPELGCTDDEVTETHGTPVTGTTLLHLAIDYDEMEIAQWLIEKGADVNARAAVDANGFGGHTPLFAAVVSQPNFWMTHAGGTGSRPFAELLLARGAKVDVRASLRKQLHPGYHGPLPVRDYRDVTPLSWGRRFEDPRFVDPQTLALLEAAGALE